MPLRIRARRSAMGSVIDMLFVLSPARLDDARDVAAQGELAEAETAHLELAEIRPRPSAALAAVLDADLELVLLRKLIDQLAHGVLFRPKLRRPWPPRPSGTAYRGGPAA